VLHGLLALLGFQFAGEAVVAALALPVPGSIIGMALLLGWLSVRTPAKSGQIITAADTVLSHLTLLFVPAGVGVLMYGDLLLRDGFAIAVALVVSALLSIAASGLVVVLTSRSQWPAVAKTIGAKAYSSVKDAAAGLHKLRQRWI
jgi:holin-like protein